MSTYIASGDWGHAKFNAYIDPIDKVPSFKHKVTGVATVCFDRQNKIVLTRHLDDGLDLLGGKIEEGEDIIDTLKREALEEGGIELISWKYIGYYEITLSENPPSSYMTRYPKNSYLLFFISKGQKITEPYGEEIKSSESFTINEIKNLEIFKHPILNEVIKLVENDATILDSF